MRNKKRVGEYVLKKLSGESYKAYIPSNLPPVPAIELGGLLRLLEKATQALAELSVVTKSIPNTSLFIYMYVRKEALLSSQIEGTQSSFSDLMLFESHQKPNVSVDDVEEVSNYVRAINYGLEKLRDGFPLSLRLLCEIHKILLSGNRGEKRFPGEFRATQNWIGGTRPGNALFVPPPPDKLMDCLSNFEKFINSEDFPILVQTAIAHVQFETIHPFLDGNGRLGRLLIMLMLFNKDVLSEPVLYISLYLKQNRNTYYNLLQEVRTYGNWETWIEFFLTGVYKTARQALSTTEKINELFLHDSVQVNVVGRARITCTKILEYMRKLPQVTVPLLTKEFKMSAPAIRNSLNLMVELGILHEISGKERDKLYIYKRYLKILEEGAKPIE